MEVPLKQLIDDARMGRPHLVILGAGASVATCLNGDKNGNKLPVMSDLAVTLGLESALRQHGVEPGDKNFEEIYSELYKDSRRKSLIETVNISVRDYFGKLALPPYPTVYDHLVLSLRGKDLIASFNWDPLLYYACWRNHKIGKLPRVVYLHGNVAVGYCLKHMQKGLNRTNCRVCGAEFVPSKLLFPIKHKKYNEDPFIKAEWECLRDYLKHAYMLTIFGYSAPQSDIEAIQLMRDAWGSPLSRDLEQTEIIDVKPEQTLRKAWEDFIHTHHYDVTNDFYKSSIGLFPRRSCEAEWNSTMPDKPAFYPQNPVPQNLGFKDLWEWYRPLIEAENKEAQA